MRNFKAFTLVEVMVSLVLTVIVAFFIYTMMVFEYKNYFKSLNASDQANDIRYFETFFRKSVQNAQNFVYPVDGTNKMQFWYLEKEVTSPIGTGIHPVTKWYRIDEYDFGSALVAPYATEDFDKVVRNGIGSDVGGLWGKTHAQLKNNKYIVESAVDAKLTVYRSKVSYDDAKKHPDIKGGRVILKNVVLALRRKANNPYSNKSELKNRFIPIFDFAIVYKKELNDGEENYDYMIYKFAMKNYYYSQIQ